MNETILEIIKLGVDQIQRVPVANFSNKDRNEAIREKFLEVLGTSKFSAMAYNENKYKIFEIIKETLSQTKPTEQKHLSQFYSNLVEEDYVEEGDVKEYEIENDAYLTVAKISGNNWDLDRQRMDKGAVVRVKTEAYYIKIYEYFKRFMTGRMDFAELASKVDESIDKFKLDLIADTFKNTIEGLPSGFSYSGAYVESEIQTVLTNVTGANEGVDVVLTGTKGALNKLQGISVANLSDAQKEEYNSKGFIREWKGYSCVELPTTFKANSITDFVFDNDTIYVLPSGVKPIKIINEGEPLVMEINDITKTVDMTQEFAVIWKIGAVAIFSTLIGSIEITG